MWEMKKGRAAVVVISWLATREKGKGLSRWRLEVYAAMLTDMDDYRA